MIWVLVVDDNETFREVAAAVVAMTGGFAVAGLLGAGEAAVDAVRAGGTDEMNHQREPGQGEQSTRDARQRRSRHDRWRAAQSTSVLL